MLRSDTAKNGRYVNYGLKKIESNLSRWRPEAVKTF